MGRMVRFGSFGAGMLPGHNAVVNPNGKKSISARSASISGEAEQAKQPSHRARPVFARDALQIHVAAQLAMHINDIAHGSGPGIKSRVAAPAAPGPQQRYSD